ncbi:helix-turn-helix domain-containing protein [Nocardia sp. CA2R105]|uniref:IclR family transcriptional regulator n=1 Tax=Nocardia coffeae TaxID=2873381 RepID=UPI001CA75A89|nr:IclR family transcriptional regulator C-terminal domain-containing protein [Nocardia coffeae]MBY8858661.1 helix-turn-helix domain-containing protein [Nocardia coffeae]
MSHAVSDDRPTPALAPEHRTVSRVMSILEHVVGSEPHGLRLGDLATVMDAPKSSIHGLVRGLIATGYVVERDAHYLQGPAIFSLLASGKPLQVPIAFHHALEKLAAEWNETALLATLVGDSVIHIDIVESTHTIRAHPPLHERRPLWPVSYGKCFLAFMAPRRRDAYLRRYIESDERGAVLRELDDIRANMIAFNRNSELCGVASPIIVSGSEVTMAVGLTGLAPRMADRLKEIEDSVREAARALSAVRA